MSSQNISDSSEEEQPMQQQMMAPPMPPAACVVHGSSPNSSDAAVKKTKKVRKADPNVISLDIGKIVSPENVQSTAKYIKCGYCSALMTKISQSRVNESNESVVWDCEYCGKVNADLDTTDWKQPEHDDVTYLLEVPVKQDAKDITEDEHMVIFCIDISGSMSITTELHYTEGSHQRVRYVSRLDAVKTAVEHQIQQLVASSPKVKVGLITFASQVYFYGDGTGETEIMKNVKLMSEEDLKAYGVDRASPLPIKDTHAQLTQKVLRLTDEGCTALGPALVCAIAQASAIKGSKVIICTDGCANEGFGVLPSRGYSDEAAISACRKVYRKIGQYAVDCGVSVSVISLAGTDCQLVQLGLVAQMSDGVIDIVDQSNLSNEFGNILSSRTLATEVNVTLCLHHTLYIRDAENPDAEKHSEKVQRMGNVSTDTEMLVQFGVRRPANENEDPVPMEVEDSADEPAASSANQVQGQLPFQVQLRFTARDGTKYLRVITSTRGTTEQRDVAEKEMDLNIVGAATSQISSTFASEGVVRDAQDFVYTNLRMVQRANVQEAENLNDILEDYGAQMQMYSGLKKKGGKHQVQSAMSDSVAKNLLQRKGKSKAFTKFNKK